jgi:MFS family permease
MSEASTPREQLAQQKARAAGFKNMLEALRHRDYGVYTAGNTLVQIGAWVQRIAVGWLVWQTTRSGLWLGLIAAADIVAALVVSPIGGTLADRANRLTIVRRMQMLALVQSGLLAFLTYTNLITVELLFLLTLAMGVISGINQPAHAALVPSLVDKQVLATAIAMNFLLFNVARFIGPLVAGIVLLKGSFTAAFVINASTCVAFLVLLTRLSVQTHHASPKPPWIDDIRDGFSYALRHPGIRHIIVIYSATAVGLRGFIDLLPGFADHVFNRGAEGLAWLTAVVGLGAIVGGLWMARRPDEAGLTALTVRCTLLFCAAALAFTSTTSYAAGLLSAFAAGVAMVMIGIATQTLMQVGAAPEMRGRVMAIFNMLFRGLPALNALILGWLSSYYGLRVPLACGALACLAFWMWARRRQALVARELENRANHA